jgi:hypothetical protein
MRPAARRQRAYRQRASRGEVCLKVNVNYFSTIDALIASSRISESDALDRTKVEAAIAVVLVDWTNKWAEARYA